MQFLQAGEVNDCSGKSGVGAVSTVVNLEFGRLGHTSMKILCQQMEQTSRFAILYWTSLDIVKYQIDLSSSFQNLESLTN